MKPSRPILGAVYQYLNKDLGYTYQEIADFFKLPTRNPVAAGIRDLPPIQKEQPNMDLPKYPPVSMRSVVFDLETTNFNAESNADILVCGSFMPLDTREVETIAISHREMMSDDRDLAVLNRVIDYLSGFDIVIGHNVAGFDLNWLTTRLLYYGLPLPHSVLYYDTYSAVKRMALKTWKNLGNLTAFFGLDGEKTKIFRPDWMNVLHPNEAIHTKAMADIVYHCEEDVKMNAQLFDILYPNDNKLASLPVYNRWL